MSKPSHRVVVLVLYLNFQLWQLGSQLKFQAIADRLLSADEVSTLTTVINKLGLIPPSDINSTYCKNRLNSDSSYNISCNCNYSDTQGNQTCHIATIIMNDEGLTTVIPEEFGDLRYLSSFNLSNNALHGPIPAALGKLIYLEILDLSYNQLTGSIPVTLGNLQNLQSLYLEFNLLDKTIPRSLGSLRNLQGLDLSYNQLTGSIPVTLGNLQNLQFLYLEFNLLDRTIPQSLGSLQNLQELYLHFNRLSGSIPDELGNLVNLTKLSLYENELSGRLPDTLGNLSNLWGFWATANSLSGTVPESFGQLTSLKYFSVAGNYISGLLPVDIIKNWTNIEYLSLLGNNFKGNLTKEVFNLPNLQYLLISDLGNATFELPSEITNTQFVFLILRSCSINGLIPKSIDQMLYLKYLDLSFNNLTGALPEYMNSTLVYMSFSTNMLNGTIPAWILQAVQTRIDLSFNNFTALDYGVRNNPELNLFACCRGSSATEPEFMYMREPLDMMNTYCPGKEQKHDSLFINCGGGETIVNGITYDQDDATSRFYTSPNKNWAYSSSGDFLVKNANSNDYTKKNVTSGVSLYDRARLSPVSLKYYAFCLREGNYIVTLKFAEIVYTQDTDYTSLRKRAFDVSIQDDKVLHNFNIREQAGGPNIPITKKFTALVNKNNSLLIIHMYWDGKGSLEAIAGTNEPAFNGPLISAISVTPDIDECNILEQCKPSWMKPLFSGLGSGLGVLLLLIGAWWAHKAVQKRKIIKRRQLFFKRNGGLLLEQQILSGEVNVEKIKLFNSKELEKSTDNFNIDRVLGQGGQGTVFKGMLADGNIVAVKKSKIDNKGKVSEFINEVIILSQINHRNIVRLLGCCLETEVPLLVYEFIPNGTLSQYIYEQNEEFPLTWQLRLKIATEIAGALSYLHVAASCPIYHRDIKSTNILLDEKYRAKIADFGTSRSVAIDQTHLTTNVHGTFGYMDPEYFQSSQFTEKSDVYSFGVVLVELLTGKKPISTVTRSTRSSEEEQEQEYRSLAAYFIDSMQEDCLFNILDARVVNEGSKEDIVIVANLARRCLNLNGRNRPTMREVTAELEAIQMSNRTHHQEAEFIPGHYPIQQCYDVVSSSGGSTWDSGSASSLREFPQSSM